MRWWDGQRWAEHVQPLAALGHQPAVNPFAALVVMVTCFVALAHVADDIVRATGIFTLPFAALGTLFVALQIIKALPRK